MALREVESGVRRDGLWAKAMVEADRTRRDPSTIYLELRVSSLRDERVESEQQAESQLQLEQQRTEHQIAERQRIVTNERNRLAQLEMNERRNRQPSTHEDTSISDKSTLASYLPIAVLAAFLGYFFWFYLFRT